MIHDKLITVWVHSAQQMDAGYAGFLCLSIWRTQNNVLPEQAMEKDQGCLVN